MSKQQILEDIIYSELGRCQSKFANTPGGNCNILCAIRLLKSFKNEKFEDTLELATFINDSWLDLELKSEQITSIIQKVKEILTRIKEIE